MADTDAKMKPSNERVTSLPNEIILEIFDWVRGVPDRHGLRGKLGKSSIWAIRLTCRRFNLLSSHLLFNKLRVDLTRKSLAYLDEVSRHPLISKGIQIITLSLTPFFAPSLAYNFQEFAARVIPMRQRNMDDFEWAQFWSPVPPHLVPDPRIELWTEIAAGGLDTSRREHRSLLVDHENYRQLYEDYRDIAGSFTHNVTSAIERLKALKWITITDNHLAPRHYRIREQHHSSWCVNWSTARRFGLEHPPIHLVEQLLHSIQQLQLPLQRLDVSIPPVAPSQKLKAAHHDIQGLTTFTCRRNRARSPRIHQIADVLENWAGLVLSPLHSTSLQKIELDLYFPGLESLPQCSMSSFLLPFSWPNLQRLSFKGPFYIGELKAIVERLGSKVDLEWSGYLKEGSWAEVLDFLKEHHNTTRATCRIGYNNNLQSYGQEYNTMKHVEREYIFGFELRLCESAANRYIEGLIVQNPITAWQMGALDIPTLHPIHWHITDN